MSAFAGARFARRVNWRFVLPFERASSDVRAIVPGPIVYTHVRRIEDKPS
jgi:hypothetical protein